MYLLMCDYEMSSKGKVCNKCHSSLKSISIFPLEDSFTELRNKHVHTNVSHFVPSLFQTEVLFFNGIIDRTD